MDHRVTVTICGNEYTFVAEEDGAYVEKVAAYVDQKMTEILFPPRPGILTPQYSPPPILPTSCSKAKRSLKICVPS